MTFGFIKEVQGLNLYLGILATITYSTKQMIYIWSKLNSNQLYAYSSWDYYTF